MSCFIGCKNMKLIPFFFFIFFGSSRSYSTDLENHDEYLNTLSYELLSRDEMVQIAGYGEEKLSTVLVTGSIECEACFQGQGHPRSWPISDATVAVKCHTGANSRSGWLSAKTDEYGEFLIDLPSHLHAIPHLQNRCLVRVLHMPKKSKCRPAYSKIQKRLQVSSFGNGIRTYTAGKIRVQHFPRMSSMTCIKKGRSEKQIE